MTSDKLPTHKTEAIHMSRLPWGRPNDWIKFKFHSAGKPHGPGLGGFCVNLQNNPDSVWQSKVALPWST